MANANSSSHKPGEAKQSVEEIAFAKLREKVVASLQVDKGTSHLLLVKKGSLNKTEREVFLSLWKRNFPGTGMLIFEVDNPQQDVVALEVKR